MKRLVVVVLLVALVLVGSALVWPADGVDLAQFARITASDTRNTFLGLWPRETDDGPFTVRDGQPETSWKVPRTGSPNLEVDFAPLLSRSPAVQTLVAHWSRPPAYVLVEALDYCGGAAVASASWDDPTEPFVFSEPVVVNCIRLTVDDPDGADLMELSVHAASSGQTPGLDDVLLSEADPGIQIDWTPNEAAMFVRIDFLPSLDASPSADTFIETVPAGRSWIGPAPALDDWVIGVTPLGADGVLGDTAVLVPPDSPSSMVWPLMGTIEGFYGTMWSDQERRKMILMLARLGLGSYLYAPKWDPLHREEWRTPYGDWEVSRFGALSCLGELVGVRMVFGLSPAYDMVVDDPGERQILLDKLEPLVDVGFRDFEIGFDDIEFSLEDEVDGLMGAKHVDLANWLKARLEEMAGGSVTIWFMPTPYSTDRQYNYFEHGTEYVDQLIDLHPDTLVLWNGPDTFSRSMSASDMADITARAGRRPVIWENMHCNDAGDAFIAKFYLAPLMDRAPDLVDAVAGFMTNPLIPGAADRLVYGSYAQYFDDPYSYDPGLVMPEAVALETADLIDRDLALWWSQSYWGLAITGPEGFSVTHNLPLDEAAGVLEESLASNDLAKIANAAAGLLAAAARMSSAWNDLHHSGFEPDLVDDLWFPAERLVDDGDAVLILLDWLGERLSGGDGAEALARADDAILDALLHDRYETSLLRPYLLRTRLARSQPGPMGFARPVIADFTPGELIAGQEWCCDVGANGNVGVFGLREALVDASMICWTPPHSGTYQVIITATTETGWAWDKRTLLVRNPDPADDDDSTPDEDADEADDGGCGC